MYYNKKSLAQGMTVIVSPLIHNKVMDKKQSRAGIWGGGWWQITGMTAFAIIPG